MARPLRFAPVASRAGGVSSTATTPEEEESLIKKAGRKAIGGIATVGNFLDIPGSMVRDVATWAPGGIPAQNPFDQLLTPFSHENRTTGRQLLRSSGMIGRRDNWGNLAGSIGLEMALDPLLPLSLGGRALSSAGQVARRANLLPQATRAFAKKTGKALGETSRQARVGLTLRELIEQGGDAARTAAGDAAKGMGKNLDDLLDQRLGGLAGVGVPFMEPFAVFGTGAKSQKVAKFLDQFSPNPLNPGSRILDLPLVGSAYAGMSAGIKGARTPLGREIARGATEAEEIARASGRQKMAQWNNLLDEAGMLDDPRKLRQVFESTPEQLADKALDPRVRQVYDEVHDYLGGQITDAAARGKSLSQLMDPQVKEGLQRYFPRGLNAEMDRLVATRKAKQYDIFSPDQIERNWFLKGWGGGSETLGKIARDPMIDQLVQKGAKRKDIAGYIREAYADLVPKTLDDAEVAALREQLETIKNAPDIPAAAKKSAINTIEQEIKAGTRDAVAHTAGFIRKLPEQVRNELWNHPMADMAVKMSSHGRSMAAADAVLEGLIQPGVLGRRAGAAGEITVGKLLQSTGFSVEKAMDRLAAKLNMKPSALKKMAVNPEVASDLMRFVDRTSGPQSLNAWLEAVDNITNLTKGLQTSIFPRFHVRNRLSGLVDNIVAKTHSRQSVRDAERLMKGETVEGAKEIPVVQRMATERGITNLTDEEATNILGELVHGHEMIGKYEGRTAEVIGREPTTRVGAQDLIDEIPGMGRQQVNWARTGRRLVGAEEGTTLNPNPFQTPYRGVRGATDSAWGPAAAGQDVGHYVEGLNRVAPFIKQLREGIDPRAAARKVTETQVGYSNRFFTDFERNWMQRLMPYFKFARGKAPWVLEELAEQPGGRLAQGIRTANTIRDPEATAPDYVQETAGIPLRGTAVESLLGSPPEGTDRYLTGFGVSAEDPLGFIGTGVRGAGLEALSRTNPLFKGPLEYFTGQSFFQKGPDGGRPMDDLDPNIGRTIANVKDWWNDTETRKVQPFVSQEFEHVMANAPINALLTTFRTITDQRKSKSAKALTLGTGMRISDISPGAQDAIVRERIADVIQETGGSTFEVTRFPKRVIEETEKTDPARATQMRTYNAILNRLQRQAKARAEARESE